MDKNSLPVDEIVRSLELHCVQMRKAILEHVKKEKRQSIEDLLHELSWKNKQIARLEASESVADKAQALLQIIEDLLHEMFASVNKDKDNDESD